MRHDRQGNQPPEIWCRQHLSLVRLLERHIEGERVVVRRPFSQSVRGPGRRRESRRLPGQLNHHTWGTFLRVAGRIRADGSDSASSFVRCPPDTGAAYQLGRGTDGWVPPQASTANLFVSALPLCPVRACAPMGLCEFLDDLAAVEARGGERVLSTKLAVGFFRR